MINGGNRNGRLFTIVGPSGSGKDSLLNGLATRLPELKIVKRFITRPRDGIGECHCSISQSMFDRLARDDAFFFSWRAHGLSYGIPRSCLEDLKAGKDVIFNGSRHEIDGMLETFPDLSIIWVSVSPDILASRLHQRGRENNDEIRCRLERDTREQPKGTFVVENNGPIEVALDKLVAYIGCRRQKSSNRRAAPVL